MIDMVVHRHELRKKLSQILDLLMNPNRPAPGYPVSTRKEPIEDTTAS